MENVYAACNHVRTWEDSVEDVVVDLLAAALVLRRGFGTGSRREESSAHHPTIPICTATANVSLPSVLVVRSIGMLAVAGPVTNFL